MIKLYKKQDGVLHYWETWNTTPKKATVHWGVVGERGDVKIVRATSQVKFDALIQEEVNQKREEGYAEPSTEALLEIEYEAKTMSSARLKKLHRLGERLDQLMGWTGLGHFDGNGFGFGKMDVTVIVVDYEIAKSIIMADLEDTEFAKYLSISRIETDDGNEEASYLTSFADHLTEQYGKPGTPVREEFEKGFEKFKLDAIVQNLPENKLDNL